VAGPSGLGEWGLGERLEQLDQNAFRRRSRLAEPDTAAALSAYERADALARQSGNRVLQRLRPC
jgi:hypothetical protein